jgi:hypothetical protein
MGLRTPTCLCPSSSEGQRHIDRFKTDVPDQTPSRPQPIQSGIDLSRSSPQSTLSHSQEFSLPSVGCRPILTPFNIVAYAIGR